MSCPIGRPTASSQAANKGRKWPDSAGVSAANDSPVARPLRLSATRLETLAQQLGERDWQVLNFLSEWRLSSGKQLVRRFWDTRAHATPEARAGRRALKRLADRRVLDPLPTRRAVGGLHGGSDTIIYGVGVAGVRLLARRGLTQKRLATPGDRFVRHTLAITELAVSLHTADQAGHLELLELQAEPGCWRGFLGAGLTRVILKPDLFVRVGAGSISEDRWFIEVDLSTEASATIHTKAMRHLAYARSASEPVQPRVLWAVPDARRAEQIAEVLAGLPDPASRLFAICLLGNVVGFLAAEARS